MSHFSTPFIVINLGCEMIYVIDQRLKMQNISIEKSEKVLTEIVTVLLHHKLMESLFLPQPVVSHAAVKQLIADISASSTMNLDDNSFNKLWDLITMLFKWQTSVECNKYIFNITRRHLDGIAALMPAFFPKHIIIEAIDKFDILMNKITDDAYKCLNNTIFIWFSQYNTKISVLLRLGLQNIDGTFKLPSLINLKYLKNVGENIYRHDLKKSIYDYETNHTEISCLLAPMESVVPRNKESLNLETKSIHLNNIEINRIINVLNTDLIFTPIVPRSTNEDLLDMLQN